MKESFQTFARELKTSFAYDRIALVLADHGRATVVADDGVGADDGRSPWTMPLDDSALGEVVRTGQTHVRADLKEGARYAEEEQLAAIGMRSRVIAPLAIAGKPLGVISVSRREADSFTRDDIDLLTLLGRQLATAVENIRAFEAERAAAEELRRLSALRADFVSLVTHELRGPMASVVGCAATLAPALAHAERGPARVVPRADRGGDLEARSARRATCSTRRGSRPARSPTRSRTWTSRRSSARSPPWSTSGTRRSRSARTSPARCRRCAATASGSARSS